MLEVLNNLIQEIANKGNSNSISTYFAFLSFVPVIIICFWYGRKISIGTVKAILFIAVIYVINFLLMLVLAWIEAGFRNFGAQNGIRSFVYTPLLCFVAAKIFRITWRQGNALWGACLPFSHGIAHIGCIFPGCCYGYPYSKGIYNAIFDTYLFPVQMLETVVSVMVGCCIIWRIRKKNYLLDGKEYPIFLVLFGSTRFICEYFRDSPRIWLGCTSLAFHALFMCLVGIIAIVAIDKKQKNLSTV